MKLFGKINNFISYYAMISRGGICNYQDYTQEFHINFIMILGTYSILRLH